MGLIDFDSSQKKTRWCMLVCMLLVSSIHLLDGEIVMIFDIFSFNFFVTCFHSWCYRPNFFCFMVFMGSVFVNHILSLNLQNLISNRIILFLYNFTIELVKWFWWPRQSNFRTLIIDHYLFNSPPWSTPPFIFL
jgi:hypothetical protein